MEEQRRHGWGVDGVRTAAMMCGFAWCAIASADPPAEAVALQRAVHRIIDTAEPAIACILVSQSDVYAELGEGPSAIPGKLGGFTPLRHMQFTDGPRRELIRRLDLARPTAVPDSYGSGVAIDSSGLILTNYHVVEKAKKIFVRLPGAGRGSYADIHAADARSDLAVLRMIQPPKDLRPIAFGHGESARKGDWVVSLANPFAAGFRDGSPSASWGLIANLRRRIPGPTDEFMRQKPLTQFPTLMQTDARLNFGCSGGALLNLEGQLIGLTTMKAAVAGGESAGGYAVPIDAAVRKIIDVLRRGEEVEYGFLGVSLQMEEFGLGRGVVVQDAPGGMPANRAGIRAGDTIVGINGNPIRDHDDLFLHVATGLAGQEATVELRRGPGKTETVTVRLVKSTHPEPFIASQRPKPVFGMRVDYNGGQTAAMFATEGVLVRELEPGSPADRKLRTAFDKGSVLIVSVNGRPVRTPAEFYKETADASAVVLEAIELGSGSEVTRSKVRLP